MHACVLEHVCALEYVCARLCVHACMCDYVCVHVFVCAIMRACVVYLRVCVFVGGCEPGYIYRVYGWEESVHCIVTGSNVRLAQKVVYPRKAPSQSYGCVRV